MYPAQRRATGSALWLYRGSAADVVHHRQNAASDLADIVVGEAEAAGDVEAAARQSFSDWEGLAIEQLHSLEHWLLVHWPKKKAVCPLWRPPIFS